MLQDLIKKRRSVRLFNGKKVPREDILSIIEAGTWAPTGCNNQELRFLVLDDEKDIGEFIKFKPFFKGISTVILVFCDMSLPLSKMYHEKASRSLQFIDTGLALENMVLYAKSLGIDSCVVNLSEYHFGQREASLIKKIIKQIKIVFGLHASSKNNFEFFLRNYIRIGGNFKIMAGVVFGYAGREPDINKEMHGGKKIMREKVDHYIIHKGRSDNG